MTYKLDWSDADAVARWLSARPTRNPITEYLRDNFDPYDMYASTVSVLFAIADVLTEIDPSLVPTEWEFRQSPFGANTEAWEYEAIHAAMADGATLDHLLHAAKVFGRLDNMNRLTGLGY